MVTLRFIKKMVVLSIFIGLLVGPAWAIEETLDRAGQTLDSAVNVTTGTFDAAVKGTSDAASGAVDATAKTGEGLVRGGGEAVEWKREKGSEAAGNAFDGLFSITDWAFETVGNAVDFVFGN